MIICNINEFLNIISSNSKQLMCIDLGKKKTGVAFSDPNRKFSLASTVIKKTGLELINELRLKVLEYDVAGIIMGIPLNDDDTLNKKCQSIKDITKNLDFIFNTNKIDLPIYYWDESFSTETAFEEVMPIIGNKRKQKKVIDKFAAKVILQDFLNFKNKYEKNN